MHVYKNEIYTHLGDYDGFAFWIHLRINDNYDRNINKSLYEYLSKKSGLPLTLGIYDVKIMLENPNLDSLSITGSFEKKPIKDVLEAICLTLELRFRFESGRYIIYK